MSGAALRSACGSCMSVTSTTDELVLWTPDDSGRPWARPFVDQLPYWPRATDDYSLGQSRPGRAFALTSRYIEPTPPQLVGSVWVDLDDRHAVKRAFSGVVPQPSLVIENPNTGHAHVGFLLHDRVPTTDPARPRPQAALWRCRDGLRDALGGDPSYFGGLIQNPFHPDWNPVANPSESVLYRFADLRLPGTPQRFPTSARRIPVEDDLGRNTWAFHQLRNWAYRNHIHYRAGERRSDWDRAVLAQCREVANIYNAAHPDRDDVDVLPFREVQSVASSVARWTWNTMSVQTHERWIERQRLRAAAGGAAGGAIGGRSRSARKVAAVRQNQVKATAATSAAAHARHAELTARLEREGVLL